MPLAKLRRKRESNSEAYASKSDALLKTGIATPNVIVLQITSQNVFWREYVFDLT